MHNIPAYKLEYDGYFQAAGIEVVSTGHDYPQTGLLASDPAQREWGPSAAQRARAEGSTTAKDQRVNFTVDVCLKLATGSELP